MNRWLRKLRDWWLKRHEFKPREAELRGVLLNGHWVPPYNTTESYIAGAGRCFHCFALAGTTQFTKPCPRRRPFTVELA